MAEPSRYTPEQLSILLRIAAGKLGRDPVKLQEELQNGRLDGLLQSLGADREKVNALLSDREGLSQLLQSPQVRTLLQQLLAGQAPRSPDLSRAQVAAAPLPGLRRAVAPLRGATHRPAGAGAGRPPYPRPPQPFLNRRHYLLPHHGSEGSPWRT